MTAGVPHHSGGVAMLSLRQLHLDPLERVWMDVRMSRVWMDVRMSRVWMDVRMSRVWS